MNMVKNEIGNNENNNNYETEVFLSNGNDTLHPCLYRM